MSGLTPGTYKVFFFACNVGDTRDLAPMTYSTVKTSLEGIQAQPTDAGATFTVKAGRTTRRIDGHPEQGGAISGAVTVASTGAGLGGICVVATLPTFPDIQVSFGMPTDPTGVYTLHGIPAGKNVIVAFHPCTYPSNTHQDQWWDAQTSASTATPLTLSLLTTTSGISAAMS